MVPPSVLREHPAEANQYLHGAQYSENSEKAAKEMDEDLRRKKSQPRKLDIKMKMTPEDFTECLKQDMVNWLGEQPFWKDVLKKIDTTAFREMGPEQQAQLYHELGKEMEVSIKYAVFPHAIARALGEYGKTSVIPDIFSFDTTKSIRDPEM